VTAGDPPTGGTADQAAVPELVPARMVNEFSYCPRLFHLEWVGAQFTDNDDTVEGRWAHRTSDAGGGRVPLPDEGQVRKARSVKLSSSTLGVVAVIDLLEGDGGSVVPVEVKKGSPPDNPDRSWEPERIQLCVQALLLREHGYTVDRGVLSFIETRDRVDVVIDDALARRTAEVLAGVRAAALRPTAPPPLVDSPKCPRCSLVGICLPDETNTLADRAARPPRRLIPGDDAAQPLYVSAPGSVVGRDKGRIVVSRDGARQASVRAIDVSQVVVTGQVQVSTQVLRELMARDIPICYFSFGGWFVGMTTGLPGKNVELRRRQIITASQGALDIARAVVIGKIRNSRTLLRRNSRSDVASTTAALQRMVDRAACVTSVGELLGVEGTAARLYFERLPTMLRPDKQLPGAPFSFDRRIRRPPTDAVNCLLSYLYGLLVKDLTAVTHAVGFDPFVGFYHQPRFGRPALALDLAEEFRPLIAESVMINLVNNGEVGARDFIVRAGGVGLTADGRRSVIDGYERRLSTTIKHPTFGYEVSYRRALEVQARVLGAHLLGEVPTYQPFVTR